MLIFPFCTVANESKTNSIGGIASQFGINVSSDNNSLASVRLIPDLIFQGRF